MEEQIKEVEQTTNIFEEYCPFDDEVMEIITIEHGVKVWHCQFCDYIRPV